MTIVHWIFQLLSTYNSHVPCVGVIAIAEINEALNSGDPEKTLDALLLPTAKLQGVNPANAKHYHDLLLTTKDLICKVKQNNSAEPMKCLRNLLFQILFSYTTFYFLLNTFYSTLNFPFCIQLDLVSCSHLSVSGQLLIKSGASSKVKSGKSNHNILNPLLRHFR